MTMLLELKTRAPLVGEPLDSSTSVLQRWLTAAAKQRFAVKKDARTTLKSGLEWIRKTGRSVFGLDDEGVSKVWSEAASGRRSPGFHGAMTRGVAETLRLKDLPILFQQQMGNDPFQWGVRLDELASVAPVSAIGRLVGVGAQHHLGSAETAAILNRLLDAQKLSPNELEAERDRIDKAIKKQFIDKLPRSAANSFALRWETELASINPSGEVELGKVLASLRSLNGASKLSEINAALYRAREKRSETEVATEVLRVKNEMLQSKRLLSLLLLAGSYRQLFDADSALDREGRKTLIELLDQDAEHVLDHGIEGGSRANKVWSERSERCIRVIYSLPEGIELADDVEFRVDDGDCKVLDSGQLEVLVSPSRTYRAHGKDRVAIAMRLQVRHADLNDVDIDLLRRTIDRFDFDAPTVRPLAGKNTGDIRIEIRDDNPSKDGLAPKLLVNGTNLAPSATSGEPTAQVFDFAISLETLKKQSGGQDSMQVSVSDGYGNVTTMKLDDNLRRVRDGWRFDRDGALKAMATAIDAEVRRSGFGKAGLRDATARIATFDSAIAEFVSYFGGNQKSVADSFAKNLQRVFQDWLNDGRNATTARAMRSEFTTFATRLRRFELARAATNGAVTSDLQQKFNTLSKPAAIAGGGNDNQGSKPKTPTTFNRKWWESGNLPATLSISSGGQRLSFRLLRGNAGPVWICTTELPVSAAEAAVTGIRRRAQDLVPRRNRNVRRSWDKMVKGSFPLVPVNSGMIGDILAAFDKTAGALNPAPGGAVAFGVPTAQEWKLAVLDQNGQKNSDYPWGREWNRFYEPQSGALAGAQKYDDLKTVTGDPNANGKFHFLAGNAGDVVSSSPGSLSGLKVKGGSLFTSGDKGLFKANGGAVNLGNRSRGAGIRLVIRPRR